MKQFMEKTKLTKFLKTGRENNYPGISSLSDEAIESISDNFVRRIAAIDQNDESINVVDPIVGLSYDLYCACVGGKSASGQPLPTFDEFKADPNKNVQFNAWMAVAAIPTYMSLANE